MDVDKEAEEQRNFVLQCDSVSGFSELSVSMKLTLCLGLPVFLSLNISVSVCVSIFLSLSLTHSLTHCLCRSLKTRSRHWLEKDLLYWQQQTYGFRG